MVEMGRRPRFTDVTIATGIAARQVIGRFGARGNRAARHMTAFAFLGRLFEHAPDVA